MILISLLLNIQTMVVILPGSPGSNLLPLELHAGALHAPPQVHDVQLHVVNGASLGELDVRLAW